MPTSPLQPSRVRAAAALAAVLTACALLSGCGQPAYTYVKHAEDRTYFKVPAEWHPLDQQTLDVAFGRDAASAAASGQPSPELWAVAYDASNRPAAQHLFDSHTKEPIVYASVEQLPEDRRGRVSLDGLRDLLLPVTPAARSASDQTQVTVLSGFSLLRDEVLTPGAGIRGVREVFVYRLRGGPPQIFDQTAYANDDASKIYVLFLRCSTQCYEQRHGEIEAVVSSFTVRESS